MITEYLWLNILIWSGIAVIGVFCLVLICFMFVTIMYMIPAKQRKVNLMQIVAIKDEQRIYLGKYKYGHFKEEQNEVLEANAELIKKQRNEIALKMAELKEITGKVDDAKKKPKKVEKKSE